MAFIAARREGDVREWCFSVMRNGFLYVMAGLDGDELRQQPLPRHMIELKPDAIRILKQYRIISRCPLILARCADDGGVERHQKGMQFVDVGALAGAET